MAKVPGGGIHVIVEGLMRAKADPFTRSGASLRAMVSIAPEPVDKSLEIEAYTRRLRELIDRALSIATGLSQDLRGLVAGIDDPLRLAYLLASLIDLKAEEKQHILEQNVLTAKLEAVANALGREIALLEMKSKIESAAQQEMTDAQRQYYLRQQLKAIQDELGEGEKNELGELRARLAGRAAAGSGRRDRVEGSGAAGAHVAGVARVSDDPHLLRLGAGRAVVRDDGRSARSGCGAAGPGSGPLRSRQGQGTHRRVSGGAEVEIAAEREPQIKGPILCFVGPPGVGKTSLGQSIARAMNRKFVRISLGGVRDEAEIRGHRRTYIGAIPGRIVQALKQAGAMNPVFMLDEIDKITAGGFQGDPAAALLEVLDPSQNSSFRDHYLEINVDLSRVLFIATANQLGTIHPALLDRMEIISLVGYTEEEKVHIARQYLIPRQLEEHGLSPDQVAIEDDAVRKIITQYTREAGVRSLERQIGAVARKIAARVAGIEAAETAEASRAVVTAAAVAEYLGPPKIHDEVAFRVSRPGVATGVAWTESGGDVLFIEASLLPAGHGNITLTGQLGNVMQESARAAVSHIRSSTKQLGVATDFLDTHDLHIHVPAGAIPKDGPSAGVTMATAIVSALRNQAVKQDVAMTGEITLSGLVLPVGGIREKALAARRHGISTFILPALNAPDVGELPPEVRDTMRFVPVSTLDEALAVALPPA